MSIMGRKGRGGWPAVPRIPTLYLLLIAMTSCMFGMSAIVFENDLILNISILIMGPIGIIIYIKWDDEPVMVRSKDLWFELSRNIMVAGLVGTVILIGIDVLLNYRSSLIWICLDLSWFGFIPFVMVTLYIHHENRPEVLNV